MREKYKRQSYLNKVMAQSRAKNGAALVLREMCWHSEFDRAEVTITRPQIQKLTGLGRSTVLRAYKFLKAEGSIVAVRNQVGGAGRATTYALRAIGQGADAAPEAQEGRGEQPEIWSQIMAKYSLVDEAGFTTWLKGCEFVDLAGGVLILKAPSSFKASQIKMHLADRLAEVANTVSEDVQRVEVRSA